MSGQVPVRLRAVTTPTKENISRFNKGSVQNWSSAACFVRSPRFIVYKNDPYVSVPSANANFHTYVFT